MSEFLNMPIDAVHRHPCRDNILGVSTAESKEAIRANILAKGIVTPLLVTAADAKENPSCIIDGHRRLEIALELGFTEVPVIVDEALQTEVAQVERMFDVAQRADFTPRERARQAAAFRTYLSSLPVAERRKRYGNKEPMEIVAMVVARNRNDVHRLDVVFTSASSTEELKAAIDQGRIPLRQAYRILIAAERRREPGSRGAQNLVNRLLAKALDTSDARKRRCEPRMPTFDAAPKPPSFLVDLQRHVAEWAIAQVPAKLRSGDAHAAFQVAIRDLMIELRAATSGFKARVRRLAGLADGKRHSILALNESLHVLNLRPVKRADDVDLAEVRRTHRLLARAYHPDLNATQGARDEFERVHSAYEDVLSICDQ